MSTTSKLQFSHVIDRLAAIQVLRYEGVGSEEEYAEVDRVLQAFAKHILLHADPKILDALSMEEQIEHIPDMTEEE